MCLLLSSHEECEAKIERFEEARQKYCDLFQDLRAEMPRAL